MGSLGQHHHEYLPLEPGIPAVDLPGSFRKWLIARRGRNASPAAQVWQEMRLPTPRERSVVADKGPRGGRQAPWAAS